jgi:hypothetical protein
MYDTHSKIYYFVQFPNHPLIHLYNSPLYFLHARIYTLRTFLKNHKLPSSYEGNNLIPQHLMDGVEGGKGGGMLEILHTHLEFIFPKVLPMFISHYSVSYSIGRTFL